MAVRLVSADLMEDGSDGVRVTFADDAWPAGRRVVLSFTLTGATSADPDASFDAEFGTWTRATCTEVQFFAPDPLGPGVEPKWLKRFPMGRVLDEARFAALDWLRAEMFRDPLPKLPLGSPHRSKGLRWYADFLDTIEKWEAAGVENVLAEVARRKRVDRNTVKQWAFRARKAREGGQI